jgi:hypothetical protein
MVTCPFNPEAGRSPSAIRWCVGCANHDHALNQLEAVDAASATRRCRGGGSGQQHPSSASSIGGVWSGGLERGLKPGVWSVAMGSKLTLQH